VKKPGKKSAGKRAVSALNRREFVTLATGSLLSIGTANSNGSNAAGGSPAASMLAPDKASGYSVSVLLTTGDACGDYRPPGIMDGMGAWSWDADTVRLFVNHELPPDQGYLWALANGTRLQGARISYFDIDKQSRSIRSAGNAISAIRDRRGEPVTQANQVNESSSWFSNRGLHSLCSAQACRAGEFGFIDDVLFTHEEVSAVEDHPHGGTIWALQIRTGELWALPALGRGSWENVTPLATPDCAQPDGHIALLLGDDLEFGGAPLYLWVGRKQPGGNFAARNGLASGQLYAWASVSGERSPEDWHGTGAAREGVFRPLLVRAPELAGKPDHDRDGYLDDTALRAQAMSTGAFMFSRPEDLATNPRNQTQAVFCSTGHGTRYPADDWGTIYLVAVRFEAAGNELRPTATLSILYDADDFGDHGIRCPDNVAWASDGLIYVTEDNATKVHVFGAQSGREASIWTIDPVNAENRRRIAEIDRSIVLPADARDARSDERGAWECSGLIDVSAEFGAADELLLLTAVQAHSIRGGALGGNDELVQGGQLLLLSRKL
jgi:secreted PhoX family phosphatase